MNKPVNSFIEIQALIKKLKPGEEIIVQAPYSTRSDIVFNLLTDDAYKIETTVPSANNRYYCFKSKNVTVAVNDGNSDLFEDVIITSLKGMFPRL